MKKKMILICFLIVPFLSMSKVFQAVGKDKAIILSQKDKPWCSSCGMHLGMFIKRIMPYR